LQAAAASATAPTTTSVLRIVMTSVDGVEGAELAATVGGEVAAYERAAGPGHGFIAAADAGPQDGARLVEVAARPAHDRAGGVGPAGGEVRVAEGAAVRGLVAAAARRHAGADLDPRRQRVGDVEALRVRAAAVAVLVAGAGGAGVGGAALRADLGAAGERIAE